MLITAGDFIINNTYVIGSEKRAHFAQFIDFELVALWQSTVNELSVALCCASIAAPVLEIRLLKLRKYAKRIIGKLALNITSGFEQFSAYYPDYNSKMADESTGL